MTREMWTTKRENEHSGDLRYTMEELRSFLHWATGYSNKLSNSRRITANSSAQSCLLLKLQSTELSRSLECISIKENGINFRIPHTAQSSTYSILRPFRETRVAVGTISTLNTYFYDFNVQRISLPYTSTESINFKTTTNRYISHDLPNGHPLRVTNEKTGNNVGDLCEYSYRTPSSQGNSQ